ncbi:hypothetical protein GSI_06036 [Ganoderma sinense ZZ0214-1]|uniref:Uncharacterized protein n=1 Tax=Ganoderma sinense ZZ0214-1 TaxID=1077348 RepID=A0A2G8SCM2_9APHY|nr:hypothetical protein GSI_06036 [Ganoderma sinense ZZ0214-1]
MQVPYPAIIPAAMLGLIILASAFYMYRREQLEGPSTSGLTAENTESTHPSSQRSLVNEMDLESGRAAEGEEDNNSPRCEPPMTVTGNSSLAFVPPPAVPPSPRSSPMEILAQPSAPHLPKSRNLRGNNAASLTRGTPEVRGAAYPYGSDGVDSVRYSMASSASILPPSYYSQYPGPGNSQSPSVAGSSQPPTYWTDEVRGEGVEEDRGDRPARAFDNGVQLPVAVPVILRRL